jgi:Ni/Co efflux regulator RcnB
MKKLALALLVGAAALAPLTLSAQTVPDPDPFYGIPNISLKIPTAAAAPAAMNPPPPAMHAGTTWSAGPMPPATIQGAGQPVQTRVYMRRVGPDGAQAQARAYGGGMAPPPGPGMGAMQQRHMMMMRGPGMGMHMGDGHRATHWQHIGRGGVLPPMWWGPQFEIGNWGMYGFPAPVSGGRWIRYYDDALMIGPDGRVIDGRYGYDWDRYGDRWSYDEDGVPMAMRDEGYGPGRDEDEWADRDGRDGPPPPPRPMHRGYGYGYGYGGGCGCGYGAPVLVSETVVTEPPVVESRTYVTTYVERTRVVHRYRPRTKLIHLAPPRSGERG